MELAAATSLARKLMQEWGLAHWEFRLNRRKTCYGVCRFQTFLRPGRIELSIYHVRTNADAEIEDTIRHEIAHALAGRKAGHGPTWQAMAVKVGARPYRCGQGLMPKGRWQAKCATCGSVSYRHRRPKRLDAFYCGACGMEKGMLCFSKVE